jgi:hypothetical protein
MTSARGSMGCRGIHLRGRVRAGRDAGAVGVLLSYAGSHEWFRAGMTRRHHSHGTRRPDATAWLPHRARPGRDRGTRVARPVPAACPDRHRPGLPVRAGARRAPGPSGLGCGGPARPESWRYGHASSCWKRSRHCPPCHCKVPLEGCRPGGVRAWSGRAVGLRTPRSCRSFADKTCVSAPTEQSWRPVSSRGRTRTPDPRGQGTITTTEEHGCT